MDASQKSGGATTTSRTRPVFFKNSELIESENTAELSVFDVCLAAERISGHSTIEGAQRIKNLWRIYPLNQEARQKLLVNGIALRSQQIDLLDENPYINGKDVSSTKVTISDIPLSVTNNDIKPLFIKRGYKPTSDVKFECARDNDGKLTRFKTGRRFLYMEIPQSPLPTILEIGGFKAKLYHKEQKEQQEKSTKRETFQCKKCLKVGHFTRECSEDSFTCYACKQPGHRRGDPRCAVFESSTRGEGINSQSGHRSEDPGRKGVSSRARQTSHERNIEQAHAIDNEHTRTRNNVYGSSHAIAVQSQGFQRKDTERSYDEGTETAYNRRQLTLDELIDYARNQNVAGESGGRRNKRRRKQSKTSDRARICDKNRISDSEEEESYNTT